MTREEIAAIDRECEEQHLSQQDYLDSHGIARHQYYRWKRRYREEDEQSLVPAGFVPMMPGALVHYDHACRTRFVLSTADKHIRKVTQGDAIHPENYIKNREA